MRTAIIGGGAAGFFLAINLKEMMPQMEVVIMERGQQVLRKVRVSGGGRCNCTNSFEGVKDLSSVYPRGHRLMKRLFHVFDHRDAYRWFEEHGVRLTTQDDHCVFPASQDAQTIIDCFLREAHRHHIVIRTDTPVRSLEEVGDYDFIAITTGGSPHGNSLQWLADKGHTIEQPVPSLFTFSIRDEQLHRLMGTVADKAQVMIPGTKLRAEGPLLITHWGLSGPAILRLSSYAARQLYENQYQMPLSINWTGQDDAQMQQELQRMATGTPQKLLTNMHPTLLPQRLWAYLVEKSIVGSTDRRWGELGRKDMNRLVNTLCNDTYPIAGRSAFKDEFVTCGGISLSSVWPTTLESRVVPRLFFAGEVLDIDGITGGFNFQAAWTTAYTVALAITKITNEKL